MELTLYVKTKLKNSQNIPTIKIILGESTGLKCSAKYRYLGFSSLINIYVWNGNRVILVKDLQTKTQGLWDTISLNKFSLKRSFEDAFSLAVFQYSFQASPCCQVVSWIMGISPAFGRFDIFMSKDIYHSITKQKPGYSHHTTHIWSNNVTFVQCSHCSSPNHLFLKIPHTGDTESLDRCGS